MILLHLHWTNRADEETGPALFLYGESPAGQSGDAGQALPSALVSPRDLRSRLKHVADGLLYECAEVGALRLYWPKSAGAWP